VSCCFSLAKPAISCLNVILKLLIAVAAITFSTTHGISLSSQQKSDTSLNYPRKRKCLS